MDGHKHGLLYWQTAVVSKILSVNYFFFGIKE